jgi:hypothetical protein
LGAQIQQRELMPFDSIHSEAAEAYSRLVRASARFVRESREEISGFPAFAESHLGSVLSPSSNATAWLAAANQSADWVPVEILAENWMPYAFHPRAAEVSWCLPAGRAVQPFHDEYVTHCRQTLVNALVSPRSSVRSLLDYACGLRNWVEPVGFIFHLSRCGSTLVSGCLAELDNCSVISESLLLTEIMLTHNLEPADKKLLLRLCLQLQGRTAQQQSAVIVKWNAWDLCHWERIQQIWPGVPALLLAREPVEILASHARSTGRHMSGDPALAHVHEVFSCPENAGNPLNFRIAVLEVLMTKMLQMRADPTTFLLDYSELDEFSMLKIFSEFGMSVDTGQQAIWRRRMNHYSKNPSVVFHSDSTEKRHRLPEQQVTFIKHALTAMYEKLISNSNK